MKSLFSSLIVLILLSIATQATADDKPLSGQAKIDSLLAELPKAKGDTNEVKLLVKLSFELKSTNPDKGIEYGLKGVNLAKKINWKKGVANSYNSLGANSTVKSDYPKASEYYRKALKVNEELGNKSGVATNLVNMGAVYLYQSDY
ncbi:MAG: tetratricopeptide repeat protein, partial [Candidatus Kapaibacterium sp.]